jgi:DNA polymerase-3 subunit beta
LGVNDALFRTQKVTIYTRLVEGRFPPWQTVIPKESKVKVPINVDKFLGAVRQAKIVTSSESKGVRFAFADGMIVLRSQGADVGESEVRLPAPYDAEPLEVSFDPDLLVDALRVLDSTEEVSLQMTDAKKASVIRTGDDYCYVVMPLSRDGR